MRPDQIKDRKSHSEQHHFTMIEQLIPKLQSPFSCQATTKHSVKPLHQKNLSIHFQFSQAFSNIVVKVKQKHLKGPG